jgi:hypothetical protein
MASGASASVLGLVDDRSDLTGLDELVQRFQVGLVFFGDEHDQSLTHERESASARICRSMRPVASPPMARGPPTLPHPPRSRTKYAY